MGMSTIATRKKLLPRVFRDGLGNVSDEEYAELEKNLKNKFWRLNNLYWIMDAEGIKIKFRLRPAQLDLLKNMHWRNVILKARQLGFTTFVVIFALDMMLFEENMRCGFICHNRDEASRLLRDKFFFAYDNLPEQLRAVKGVRERNKSELLLSNNSSVRCSTSLRSGTYNLVHISEHGKICANSPDKAKEIRLGTLPAVHECNFLFIESTAEGPHGDFHKFCRESEDRLAQVTATGASLANLEMKFHFYPWYDNPSNWTETADVSIPDRLTEYFDGLEVLLNITLGYGRRAWYTFEEKLLGDDMKQEHPATPDEAFSQVIEGAYYKRQMTAAYAEGRIISYKRGERLFQAGYPVYNSWDLGFSDDTGIVFFQLIGGMIYVIDYYENYNEGLPHYAKVMRERQVDVGYKYADWIFPHDFFHHEWGTGVTRDVTARTTHGIRGKMAPNVSKVDGIEAVRDVLDVCIFDEVRAEHIIKCLNNYRKEWDARRGMWRDTALHDWTSHGADAFRYLALYVKAHNLLRENVVGVVGGEGLSGGSRMRDCVPS